jgi:NAD dependent epimerase/dehydratase family enzyme
MIKLFKIGFGGYFGKGLQYMPWVHVEDLVSQYVFALENENMSGSYNTSAGDPVNQKTFMKSIQKVFGFLFTLSVPVFAARIVKGEFANALLGGQRIDSTKIKNSGFKFKFEDLNSALLDIKNKYYGKS